MEDVIFFRNNAVGQLRQLSRKVVNDAILSADSATLKLNNQKNGWQGVCVNKEANGEVFCCPVRALGRRYVHIWKHTSSPKTYLSAYFVSGFRHDVMDENIRDGLKWAANELDYPAGKGALLDCIGTHSLQCGGRMHCTCLDILVGKFKRWVSVEVSLPRSILATNLHVFQRGCRRICNKKLAL